MLVRYAVIGNPVRHSLSPMLHQQFAKAAGVLLQYDKITADAANFDMKVRAFFKAGGLGLNVTAPAKQLAFDLAAEKTPRCSAALSANTLWQDKNGLLCGDNTDGVGFIQDIKPRIKLLGARVLCLGAGGAISGILPALLAEAPESITLANRREQRAHALMAHLNHAALDYQPIDQCLKHKDYDVVIHALGEGFKAVYPALRLSGQPFCYDLSYARSGVTPFVTWARSRGYPAVDGFGMLVAQAAEAFFVWHGTRPIIMA